MTKPIIEYFPNGQKALEVYRVNGKYHRDPLEGPAVIEYHPNGRKVLEQYWFNGKYHNPYGPAIIDYGYDYTKWFLNNTCYTHRVNEYLDKHNLIWQDMYRIDFDIMWTCIL